MGRYLGCVSIFSGRPDPTWQVEEDAAQRLETIWEELEPFAGQRPSTPQLGYRGCSMRCAPDLEYIAYGGVITKKVGNKTESRKDDAKRFESLLLATAPKRLLPNGLIDT